MAVHRGAHKKNNLRVTRRMAQDFFAVHEIPNTKVGLQHIQFIARYFNQEIILYEVTDESVFVLCGQFILEEEEEEEEEKYLPMTIGVHKEHASFITDLERQLKYMNVHSVGQDSRNHVIFYTMLQGAQDLGARRVPVRKCITSKA